jgi:hypothetical protein
MCVCLSVCVCGVCVCVVCVCVCLSVCVFECVCVWCVYVNVTEMHILIAKLPLGRRRQNVFRKIAVYQTTLLHLLSSHIPYKMKLNIYYLFPKSISDILN